MNAIRSGILLSLLERNIVVALALVQTAVVSRILSADDIGLAAVGIATVQLLGSLRDLGTANYLIQQKDSARESARTAFTVLLFASVSLSGALYLSSGAIAEYYRQAAVGQFLQVLALGFLVSPFASPLMALMQRDLQFGSLAFVNTTSAAAQIVALVALAYLGFGAMSFAWAAVASSVAMLVTSLIRRPDLCYVYAPSLSDWRAAIAFGGVSSVTGLINRAYEMLPILILGRSFPLEVVGLYSRALLVSQVPERLLFASLSNVVLPVLSQEARAGRSLGAAYLTALGYITVVQWPILILVAALAHPMVMVLLGSSWTAAVPIVQLTALASILYFPAMLSYPMLVSSGGLKDTLTSSLIHVPISAAIIFWSSAWGPVGIAAGQFLTFPFLVLIDIVFIRRHADVPWVGILRSVWKSAVVALASAVVPAIVVMASPPGPAVTIPLAFVAGAGALVCWLVSVAAVDHPIFAHVMAVTRFMRPVRRGPVATQGA